MPLESLQELLERVRGRELDLDSLLGLVIDTVCEELQADRGTLYLVDHANQQLVSRAAHLPEIAEIRLDIGEGLVGWVARHRSPVVLPDARKDPRHAPQIDQSTGYRTHSLMALPVDNPGGELQAVLQLLNKKTGHFGRRDLAHAEKMAQGIASLLDSTSLRHQLRPGSRQRLSWRYNNIIGDSPGMRAVYGRVSRAARTGSHGSDSRRERYGQGAGRPGHPLQLPPGGRSLRQSRLRRTA
jgi:Nif-specific regulatory protein